jgi:hypothetical protein
MQRNDPVLDICDPESLRLLAEARQRCLRVDPAVSRRMACKGDAVEADGGKALVQGIAVKQVAFHTFGTLGVVVSVKHVRALGAG